MDIDRRTIVAVALCVLFLILYRPILHLFGVDKYLAPAPPKVSTVDTTSRDTSGAAAQPTATPQSGSTLGAAASGTQAAAPATPPQGPGSLFATPPAAPTSSLERTYEIETPLYRATFSSRGARLVSVELKRYASAHGASSRNGRPIHLKPGEDAPPGDRVVLAGGPLFGLDLGSGNDRRELSGVVFAARESLDAAGGHSAITFEATDASGAYVRLTYRARTDTYAMDLETEIRGVPVAWRLSDYSLTTGSWPLLTESDLLADARGLSATSMVGTNLHREHAPGIVGKTRRFDGNAAWAAVQSRYFLAAVAITEGVGRGTMASALRRPLTPAEEAALSRNGRSEMEVVSSSLVVGLPSELKPIQRFVLYAGPSDVARLAKFRLGLDRIVDLGWSWIRPASRGLLALLKGLYAVVRNYGLAILLLATLVRVLLHPLNMVSMRSMRAMQRLQPEMERIREKYKNDAQAMNTATMALYREHKVNPAGGCLPMLIQIPVFIALYQVLFNAIELRQAPFVAWIHDLSAPDLLFSAGPLPVRLLPLLMLGTGLLSQRVTPTDPRQAPTMYIMNAFMTVFFYNLPSGLVLYWTIMNLLTALQQWMVLRQDGGSHAVVVPEPAAGRGKGRR